MKVALCCIGRLENRYAVEFVAYYKQLGFDHIYIADNNYNGEEYFEDVLQNYIDENFITIYNYRNKEWIGWFAYSEMYQKIYNIYDWVAFFDFDEFLTLEKDKNIKEYLSRKCFNKYNQILINWRTYTDNDLIYDDGRGCLERFTKPMPLHKYIQYNDYEENEHVKCIIRGNINNLTISIHLSEDEKLKETTCNSIGKKVNTIPFQKINYKFAYIKHFTTKTIDEWINYKIKRRVADRSINDFNRHYPLERFFKINKLTKEKKQFLKNNNINVPNINDCKNFIIRWD